MTLAEMEERVRLLEEEVRQLRELVDGFVAALPQPLDPLEAGFRNFDARVSGRRAK